jgi:hypothetical protein
MARLAKWSEERRRRLALLWKDRRKSLAAIARELETNPEAVLRQAKALGLDARPTGYSRWLAARSKLLRETSYARTPNGDPSISIGRMAVRRGANCR